MTRTPEMGVLAGAQRHQRDGAYGARAQRCLGRRHAGAAASAPPKSIASSWIKVLILTGMDAPLARTALIA